MGYEQDRLTYWSPEKVANGICPVCGERHETFCPDCGHEYKEADTYCIQCGHIRPNGGKKVY